MGDGPDDPCVALLVTHGPTNVREQRFGCAEREELSVHPRERENRRGFEMRHLREVPRERGGRVDARRIEPLWHAPR